MSDARLALRLRRCAVAVALAWTTGAAWANPVAPTVASGQASFSTLGSTLTVTNSPGAIINWQSFSIGSGEITRFVQQNAASAVLNRVTGQDPSSILGTLQSNGRVYLINPNGIVFGAGSVVDVAGLTASTLKLSDQDFLAGRNVFRGGAGAGSLTNQGAITTPQGGQVYLVAPNIENSGVIQAPGGEVILAAGHSVDLVDSANPKISVALNAPDTRAVNVGQVLSHGGRIGIYGALVNQRGTVSADSAAMGENGKIILKATKNVTLEAGSVTSANGVSGGEVTVQAEEGTAMVSGTVSAKGSNGKGGEIRLLGQQVGVVAATVDASGKTGGGTVLVGGAYRGENPVIQNARAVFVGSDAVLRADGVAFGDGGTVIVWSEEATRVYGSISARGGVASGNGGFVETSGGYLDVAGIRIDAAAANGTGGTWLLDPFNISIVATADANIGSSGANPVTFTATAAPSEVNAGSIETLLNAGTSVIIDTSGGGAEQGNISVDTFIDKIAGGAASLTLKAHNDITVNYAIASTVGALDVNLIADQDSSGAGAVNLNAPITSNNGNISISAAGNITFNAGVNNLVAGTGNVTLASTGGAVLGDPMGAPYDVIANSLNVSAANGIGNMFGSMFYVDASSVTFNNSGSGGVGIAINHAGASSISGSNAGGGVRVDGVYSASPTTIGPITAAGDVLLRVNNPNITGAVNAGTHTVYLSSFDNSPVLNISIGGAQVTDYTQAELTNITAGDIVVGYDNFGNTTPFLTVDSTVNLGSRHITLKGGSISLNGGSTLTATGGIVLNSSSGITLNGELNAGSGAVNLTAVSSIADGNGAWVNNVNAGSLSATAGTHIDLDTSVGSIIATGTAGNVTIREADGATGVNVTAGGNIILNSAAGSLGLGTVTAGGTVSLDAITGSLTGGTISGTGLTAFAQSMNLTTNVGTLDLNAASVGGGITVNQAGAVTVANASTSDGSINIHSGGAMNASNVSAGGAWGINLSTGSGNLTVGTLDATGDYVNLSAAGAIVDGNGGGGNVVAAGTHLNAGTGIGTAGDPLDMQVTDLWSASGSGGAYIDNISAMLNAWSMTGAGVVLSHSNNLGLGLIDVGSGDVALGIYAGAILDLNGAGVNNFVARNLTLQAANGADFDYMISGVLDTSGVTGVVAARVYPPATVVDPVVNETLNTTTSATNSLVEASTMVAGAATEAAPVQKAAAEESNGEDAANGQNGDQEGKKKDAKKPRSCN